MRRLRRLRLAPILNAKGEPVKLTAREQYHADWTQRMLNDRFANDLAYEIPVTTLTQIQKLITEQKFYEIAPAKYLPIRVGQGTWSAVLTTYRSFELGDNFETGIINTGSNNTRLAQTDAGVDAVNVSVNNWAKSNGWSIFDLQQAALSGNWDVVSAKEESRKKNWDLGIQRIAFLGAVGFNQTGGKILGLLNQAGITVNTAVITKAISTMSATELSTFCAQIVNAYRANCDRTAMPSRFIMPESDYLGMASQSSPEFPMLTKLALVLQMFKDITQRADFQVLPLSYGDVAYSGYTYQQYVLLNYDEKSIRADIPLDYTNTLANSIDNFTFQNAAYGQFTGVQAYRPKEMMYFQYTP